MILLATILGYSIYEIYQKQYVVAAVGVFLAVVGYGAWEMETFRANADLKNTEKILSDTNEKLNNNLSTISDQQEQISKQQKTIASQEFEINKTINELESLKSSQTPYMQVGQCRWTRVSETRFICDMALEIRNGQFMDRGAWIVIHDGPQISEVWLVDNFNNKIGVRTRNMSGHQAIPVANPTKLFGLRFQSSRKSGFQFELLPGQ